MNKTKKLKDNTEVLLGMDIYNRWSVTHWSEAYDLLFSKKFETYCEADKFFENYNG